MSDRSELQARPSQPDARPVSPAVDIFEDSNGITLLADMPGVSRDSLEVHVEGGRLTVEGAVDLDLPQEMQALWAEVQIPRFRRAFNLSGELDASRIDANLKDGVLTLRVPKQPHAQPRRIEVRAA